jgi:hypothetical protein
MRFVANGKVYLTDGGAEIVWDRPADERERRTREIVEDGGVAVADAHVSIDSEKKASALGLLLASREKIGQRGRLAGWRGVVLLARVRGANQPASAILRRRACVGAGRRRPIKV